MTEDFPLTLNYQIEHLNQIYNNAVITDDNREDLTELKTYAIDNIETIEIDDAISLEKQSDSYIVWIHIADPSSLIPINSPIDLEARKRANTLYLYDKLVPMLPIEISNKYLSLKPGKISPAISVAVKISEYGEILNFNVMKSIIKTRYKLSYEECDELIDLAPKEETDLHELSSILSRRLKFRLKNGAISIEQPIGTIVKEQGKPTLKIIEPSPSRRLISEAMILMGTVIADLANKKNITLPFRTQDYSKIVSSQTLQHLSEGPVRNSAIKKNLTKGRYSIKPSRHCSMGLDHYVQFTSPIRRYIDLLSHHQISSFLLNKELMGPLQVDQLITGILPVIRESQQISNEDKRRSLQIWLQENSRITFKGIFLRWLNEQDKIALVNIIDLAMDLACTIKSGHEPLPGDITITKVASVDHKSNQLEMVGFLA